MNILSLALTFFLVANPIGNSPTILSLLKDFSFENQKKIILREALIALLVALFFQYFGEYFLYALQVSTYTLTLTGGTILFILALQMIFHREEDVQKSKVKEEPFIVPIATPLISGPGLMAMIMVNAATEANNLKITGAILITWIGVTLVLVSAPYLQKMLGKCGMLALEQIMGMILGLISMSMIVDGVSLFIQTL